MTVNIRPYEPADREGVRAVVSRTPLPDGTLQDNWPAELEDIAANFAGFCVAVDTAGSVVGIVGVQDTHSYPMTIALPDFLLQPVRTARLRRLDVSPERQRQGVGRRLSQTVIDWARNNGYTRVILDTSTIQTPAIALYESLGFQRRGQTRFLRWDILWLELRL